MLFASAREQSAVEVQCERLLHSPSARLRAEKHASFLFKGTEPLNEGFVTLDAARPWLFYWCLNGLALLKGPSCSISDKASSLKSAILECQHPDGGIGGGFGQLAHLAPTYATVLAAAIVGDEDVFAAIDRKAMYGWLMSLKQINGGFAIQHGGEVDTRAAYLALTVASLLNLMTEELVSGTYQWIISCQRYEGGLAGCPDGEAHTGPSFCALAALCILDKPGRLEEALDLPALLRWLTHCQMAVEGGFSGRTNKLVDGCYSWWTGAQLAIVETALGGSVELFDRSALSAYILKCCQSEKRGGLRDKPGKSADYYHTCYCLAGLSITQSHFSFHSDDTLDENMGSHAYNWHVRSDTEQTIVTTLHPLFSIPPECARRLRGWSTAQSGHPPSFQGA
ncbi:terpenoid cyclases/protein prenyltransferase alpha-alpha toroid [Protomyces lactucae-debilis]|uniref:Protein farnesyltransferase subunit beta n=1 Tax=Protomyces lactucae-debilis TaxID=2754530 RepID=A0A1Y2F0Q0_PROLT|nr:terpenoid cyclases/protein prenyltransferase alpha-alpha toroid [Protomyces lactucae-debilis]ORY77287.1 terpenoid cyclases/protein prenyltransferase alpha-alpha toroid [Protomyces lactucae-debilis]